jgi:hypothetical protein
MSWNQFAIHYLELRKYIRLESRIDSSTSQQTIRLRHSVRQQKIRLLQTTLTVRISPGDMVQLSHFLPNTPLPLPLQQTSFPTFAHPVCTLLLLLTLQLPPVPVQLLPSSARLTGSFWCEPPGRQQHYQLIQNCSWMTSSLSCATCK